MNSNETRTLWISVGTALLAVFLVYSYSQEKKAEYDRRFGTSKRVVVAKEDISEMQTIDDTLIDIVEKPVDFIEPGSVTDAQLVIGQVAATPIRKGEQITNSQLLEPGPLTGIAQQVSPGKRAVTIPVDEVRGVAKLIKPGDRIDLVAALDYGKGSNIRREVKTIMQDVVVLATGLKVVNNIPRLFEKASNGDVLIENLNEDYQFSNITLEVNPKQAQDLIYILSVSPGSLFAMLRNPNDRTLKKTPITTVDSVLGKASRRAIAKSIRQPTRFRQPASVPKVKKRKKKKGPFVEL